ncbi:hypothetical protein AB4039_22485 [Streptomyces sp. M-16]|uniref:hypothetical protein n=1 Tax=Streptomyces sp. M-16 TaxID=3233040 RepID=UPI00225593C6
MTAEGSATERHMIPLTERGAAGRENHPAGIYLDAVTDGANTEGLKTAAGWHLMRFGFNYARGAAWAPYTGSASSEAQWKGVVVDAARRAPVATHGARRHHGNPFWRHLTFTNDIEVRITVPHEADRTPRPERLRCTVKPFDASNPSYTGDPHARGWPKIGPDQEGTVTGSLSGLFSNGGQQLCQDRITILVPDGSIQP